MHDKEQLIRDKQQLITEREDLFLNLIYIIPPKCFCLHNNKPKALSTTAISYSELPWTEMKDMLKLCLENHIGLALEPGDHWIPLQTRFTMDTRETLRQRRPGRAFETIGDQGDQYH